MELENLAGIGPKSVKLYNKLEIYNSEDLINYYPYKYNIYNFNDLINTNDTLIINGYVESNPNIFYIKKNLNRLFFRVNVNNYLLNVTIFNRAFIKPYLTIGKNVTLIGKYDNKKNSFIASDIKFDIKNGDVEPVYHLTKGLSNNMIRKSLLDAFDKSEIVDMIPKKYNDNYKFLNKKESLKLLHFPSNVNEIKKAKVRLIYEELFEFSFKMNYLKNFNKGLNGIKRDINNEKINYLISKIPYNLTSDQERSVKEILDDLQSDSKMNRLLLGDVGSGKTVVSMIAIYANYLSGMQSALMAPTEILALQHYESINKFLTDFGVSVDIITGSMSVKEKKCIYDRVKSGQIDLLIGTHAILNDNLEFQNLGLVITDEQHRFGVNQRSILQKKGMVPDILYLSATPIPRTYAMTIYGDLDISMIKTKPSGRKDIITKVKKENDIKDVLSAMLGELKNGHQIYVISPLVEQNDEMDLSSVNLLKEKMDLAFNKMVNIDIIHGKMKQAQKDAIMNNFKNKETQILISTTVIEVGIDVPNATMIVIFNAERFGLATLHQLRGRVGRNDLQSYCYLISNFDNARLKVMEESNDGFYISEKDFELRGHGDLFGTRQHGDMHFKLANLKNDYSVLVQAKNDSNDFIKSGEYKLDEYYKNISEKLDIAK